MDQPGEHAIRPEWSLRLLGEFSVRRRGRTSVPFTASTPSLLVARLALSEGTRWSRSSLCDLLWPGDEPEASRPRLRTTLARARELFGDDSPIEANRLEVWIDSGRVETDYGVVHRALRRMPSSPNDDRIAEVATLLERHSGPLLPGFAEPWIVAIRTELASRLFDFAMKSARECVRRDDVETALQLLANARRIDPISETAVIESLELLERAGRSAEGVRLAWEVRAMWKREYASEPPARIRALESVLWSNLATPLEPPRSSSNHGLVGRDAELESIDSAVRRDRWVTLVGIGGVGKTSLARAVLSACGRRFADGGTFVDLTDVAPGADLGSVLMSALALGPQPGRSAIERAMQALSNQRRLLVLDNCEHVVAECRALADEILHRTSSVVVLATSRVPIGTPMERTIEVAGLDLPRHDSGHRLSESPAVRLFMDRAAGWLPRKPRSELLHDVAAVVRQLDGIPLAIELAAARCRLLSTAELRERLRGGLDLLSRQTGDSRRNVRAVVEWSIDRLSAMAQDHLRRLAVFPAGWTIDEATSALAQDRTAPLDVFDSVTELLESSLVRRMDADDGRPRFRMLETVRMIALERLVVSGGERDARDEHLIAYRILAEDLRARLPATMRAEMIRQFGPAWPNLSAALLWAGARDAEDDEGLRLVAAIGVYLALRGVPTEGVALVRPVLDRAPAGRDPSLYAEAELAMGRLQWIAGDTGGARDTLTRNTLAWRSLGRWQEVSYGFYQLGSVGITDCDLAFARDSYRDGLETASRSGSVHDEGLNLFGLATVANLSCQFDEGIALGRRAIRLLEETCDVGTATQATTVVGECAIRLGLPDARQCAQSAIAAFEETHNLRIQGFALHLLSESLREAGDLEGAREACEEAIEIRKQFGEGRTLGMSHCLRAGLALLEGDPDRGEQELAHGAHAVNGELRWLRAVGYDVLAAQLAMAGRRWRLASEALCRGLRSSLPVWGEWVLTDLLICHAQLRFLEGEPGRAVGSLASAMAVRRDRGWTWYAESRLYPAPTIAREDAALDLRRAVDAAITDLTS